MRINFDKKLDLDDVLLVPQRSTISSRNEVELEREFLFYHSPRKWRGIPIISTNMSCISGFLMARTLQKYKMITFLHKYFSVDKLAEEFNSGDINPDYCWLSIGYLDSDLDKLNRFRDKTNISPNILIDVPNGYFESFVKFCAKVRNLFCESIIFGGNVTTPEMVQELIIAGKLDGVRIGIGGSLSCSTRFVTGVGYPMVSAINECSHVAHGLKSGEKKLGLIIADGGFRNPGDLCKGFAAGADFISLGTMFAGVEENSDVSDFIVDKDNNKCMIFYGMSTHYAQKKFGNGIKDYRASEGQIHYISYKGSVINVIQEILGGLRSCATYIGARSLKDFNKCAEFIIVNKIHQTYSPELGK